MNDLTNAQLLALKNWIIANHNSAYDQSAVDALNSPADPTFYVWRDVPMETVLNTITFANMTPMDAVPTDTELNVAVWQARSLACQGKQFNLQNLTIGRTVAPMKRANYRAALQDCLTSLPAGASGNSIAANWVGVRDSAKGAATVAEQLLATGTGSLAQPADLAANGEGAVTLQNVIDSESATG